MSARQRGAAAALWACGAALLLAGCAQAPKPLYGWGSYQGQVYEYFKGTGATGPEQQAAALQADLERIRAAGAMPAPGLHAHLGLLYANTGHEDAALREFQTEKALFPESAHYIDFLLTKAKASAERPAEPKKGTL